MAGELTLIFISFFVNSVLVILGVVIINLYVSNVIYPNISNLILLIFILGLLFCLFRLKNNFFKKRIIGKFYVKRSKVHQRIFLALRTSLIIGLIGSIILLSNLFKIESTKINGFASLAFIFFSIALLFQFKRWK